MAEQYPRNASFHEAGHAVVAHYLDHEVVRIHVNKDERGGTEVSLGSKTPSDAATIIWAGLVAQNIWIAPSKHWASSKDTEDFFNLVAKEGLSDDEREDLRANAHERAGEILNAHKAQVEAVAERLIERGEVSGSEFLELIRGAG
jgi:ATP-dependent Zn protease